MKTLVHVDNEQIESVLKQCSICFVGMADTDGTPYVIPMNFGYKDGTLYLHSAQEGRSISILNRNPRVCISFCPTTELAYQNVEVACSYRMRASSVICWGNVVFEEDYDKKVEALDILWVQAGNGVTDAVDVIGIVQFFGRNLHRILYDNSVHHPQRFAVTDQRGSSAYS